MGAEDTIESVGIAVDLLDGQATLATLRAIRAEMVGISNLSGRGGGGSGGSIYGPITPDAARIEQQNKAREKSALDSIKREAQQRIAIARVTTNEEIQLEALAINKRLEFRTRANAVAAQLRRESAAAELRETEQLENSKQRIRDSRGRFTTPAAVAKQRARQLEQDRVVAESDISNGSTFSAQVAADSEARRQEVRNIAARQRAARERRENAIRDPSTGRFTTAEALRERERFIAESDLARGSAFNSQADRDSNQRRFNFRQDAQFTRVGAALSAEATADSDARREALNIVRAKQQQIREQATINSQLKEEASIQKQISAETSFATHDPKRSLTRPIAGATAISGPERGPNGEKITTIDGERGYVATIKGKAAFIPFNDDAVNTLRRTAGSGSTERGPNGERLTTVQGERGYMTTVKGIPTFIPHGPTVPPPSSPGGGGGGDDEEGGSGGGSGILGTVGRLTRNFLIYRALTSVTFGIANYTREALKAAQATSEQANALTFATIAAKGNLQANRDLAEELGKVGFDRIEGQKTVAVAARATYRHPELTGKLTELATNIAAAQGGGLQETPQIIEDIIGGRDRAYREDFNITPEEIYKKAAKAKLAQSTNTFGLNTVGKGQDYDTDAQKIAKYVGALSEEEKETLRLNYAVSQNFRFQGDAAARAQTLAGKMDLVSASFSNAKGIIGGFITDVKPVSELFDRLGKGAGVLGGFRPPALPQTGPENTITDANVLEAGREASTSARAKILKTLSGPISTFFNPLNFGRENIQSIYNTITGQKDKLANPDSLQYDQLLAENQARAAQAKQRDTLRQEGRLGYRALNSNPNDPNTDFFSYEELRKKNLSAGDILKNYIEELKPILDEGAKALAEYRKTRQEVIDSISASGKTDTADYNHLDPLYSLDAKRDAAQYVPFKPGDYDEKAKQREDDRKIKDKAEGDKQINRYVSQLGNALSKLREAQQGSFRLPGDIGVNIAGADNPFVKALADEATAAERMKQQWGFLGKAAVDYFTTLERKGISRQLLKLDYESYGTSSGLRDQSAREIIQRSDSTQLSRKDQEYLDIQTAIVDRAVEIPKLWAQAATVLGYTVNPLQQLRGRIVALQTATGFGARVTPNFAGVAGISSIGTINPVRDADGNIIGTESYGKQYAGTGGFGGRVEGFSAGRQVTADGTVLDDGKRDDYAAYLAQVRQNAGLSPQVQAKLKEQYAESALGILNEFTPQQIRGAGLQGVYAGAINVKAQGLNQRISDAQEKARIGALEDERLSQQLAADDRFRKQKLAAGQDAGDVGRESDSLLLSRTNGINPRDLTRDQFQNRQDALRRGAERAEQDRQEAKAAVQEGLQYQAAMLQELQGLREALLGSDGQRVLIQIENDTQARTDQENLQALSSGNYNVPLGQTGVKSNPYSSSFDKYKRGGRKR